LSGHCQEQGVKIVYRDRPQQVISQPKIELIRVIDSGSKWMKNTGEKVKWKKAKEICRAKGGRLPTIEELRKVVTGCGGVINDYENNRKNSSYQACYKAKGFTSNGYWSSTTYASDSSYAWLVYFYYGSDYRYDKTAEFYARCVRGGQ
jgi:hypothetical protein